MDSMEQRARDVAAKSFAKLWDSPGTILQSDSIVAAISRAGLLLTPLAEEAMEACVKHYQAHPDCGGDNCGPVSRVGRRILAERAKREGPWRATNCGATSDLHWAVENSERSVGRAYIYTEAQARAVAEALNKLEKQG